MDEVIVSTDPSRALPSGWFPGHLVTVTIDGEMRRIRARPYRVARLKEKLGVPPERELDVVKDGEITPIADDGRFKVEGCEVFISHCKTGGAA